MRIDGVKVGVCEVMGLEIDAAQARRVRRGPQCPGLSAAASGQAALLPALPACAQGCRESRPRNLPRQTHGAADSLDRSAHRP